MDGNDVIGRTKAVVSGVERFVDEMREQGVHLGMGTTDCRCVTCGESWPCAASRRSVERSAG